MPAHIIKSCTAFAGTERIASGDPREVALASKKVIDSRDQRNILIFDDATAEPIEIDFRGTVQDVVSRLSGNASEPEINAANSEAASERRSPGRPKLGVVGREVTLLPRHWEWLNSQPGGASVALRKLVEQARRVNGAKDRVRRSREAGYRFISAMAGNEPGFEEAARSLFAGDAERFEAFIGSWPTDIHDYAEALAKDAFARKTI